MRSALLSFFLLTRVLCAQELTPLDSLYAQDTLNFAQRTLLKPIQTWQHFSYASSELNCQFEKSCSNFMIQAILERGVLQGTVIGTDRIIRCNPSARHYHLQLPNSKIQYDGRLVDPLVYVREPSPGKSPILAASLSIIPGLGRVYAGHPLDGLLSFMLVSGFAYNTYNHTQAENPVRAGINASFMTLFWLADFYGAYRTAKMFPPANASP